MTPISITDLAKAAGVSPSTVSRALQDHPRISLEKRASIRALAEQLAYQPSQIARSLVTGRTRTLGVVITDVTDPFVAEVMKGAEQAGREAGFSLLFATSGRDPSQELAAARLLKGRQVDGMIVISSRTAVRYAELLGSTGMPLVLVNNALKNPQAHSVCADNHNGILQAVSHLQELGHVRIAFVSGPEGGRSSRERQEAFCEALACCGLSEDPGWVIKGSGMLEDGPRALSALTGLPQRPTAVLCYNDLTAIGLIRAASAIGVRVPEHLSVIGYDNISLSAFTVPPLTTVDQPKEALGRMAVDTCVRALGGEEVPDLILPSKLIIRESTSPCRNSEDTDWPASAGLPVQ